MSLPVSSTMYTYLAGVPTPKRVKYSPLPWARPETMELLKPEPDLGPWVWFGAEASLVAMVVKDWTLAASLWSLRWKSCSGVLLEERESMWWRSSERVVVESGSGSATRDSGSGHERVCAWGRLREWRSRVWVWN